MKKRIQGTAAHRKREQWSNWLGGLIKGSESTSAMLGICNPKPKNNSSLQGNTCAIVFYLGNLNHGRTNQSLWVITTLLKNPS